VGTTTFSGPLKAGDKKDSDANGPANVGWATLTQSGRVTQSTTAVDTGIVIPANSEIIRMDVVVDKTFDGTNNTCSVGFNPTGDNLTDNDVIINNPGFTSLTPNGDLADIKNWVNVGPNDVKLLFRNNANGGGAGYLRVSYVQARGLVINN
jgi:hypothetical protein